MPHRRNTLSGQGRHPTSMNRAVTAGPQRKLSRYPLYGGRPSLAPGPAAIASSWVTHGTEGIWYLGGRGGLLTYYNHDTFFLIMGQYQDR